MSMEMYLNSSIVHYLSIKSRIVVQILLSVEILAAIHPFDIAGILKNTIGE